MKKFIIHQDYTEVGTNYYEVEANSLKEAIERVNNLDVERYDCDVYDFDCDYGDSFECDEKGLKI